MDKLCTRAWLCKNRGAKIHSLRWDGNCATIVRDPFENEQRTALNVVGRRMEASGKVAVIVPMFNAATTIAATLDSIVTQTYRNLDIVVVDDGSRDQSTAIVEASARRDARVRLIHQQNAGVAAARNAGAVQTDAALLAFCDADDLWAPQKIKLQVDLVVNEPAVDVVYCGFAQICAEGRIFPPWPQPEWRGSVLRELCRHNFVGNGSSLLVRRAAFEKAGGFDATLRARHAQGCEDWLMCLRLAEHCQFDVVPEFLVGYRQHARNMSNDGLQMLRSLQFVVDEYRTRFPEYAADLEAYRAEFIAWIAERTARLGDRTAAAELAGRLPAPEADRVRVACARAFRSYLKAKAMPTTVRRVLKALPIVKRRRRPVYLDVCGGTQTWPGG